MREESRRMFKRVKEALFVGGRKTQELEGKKESLFSEEGYHYVMYRIHRPWRREFCKKTFSKLLIACSRKSNEWGLDCKERLYLRASSKLPLSLSAIRTFTLVLLSSHSYGHYFNISKILTTLGIKWGNKYLYWESRRSFLNRQESITLLSSPSLYFKNDYKSFLVY